MSTGKNFNKWFILKPKINKKPVSVLFNEREIWWCSVGVNVGVEIDGKNNLFERPVLIIKKYNANQFLGLFLTSVQKTGPYFSQVRVKGVDSLVILSQPRALDVKRLIRRLAKLTTGEFSKVKQDWLNTLA